MSEKPKISRRDVDMPSNLVVHSTRRPSSETVACDFKDFAFIIREPILCAGFRKFLQISFSEENLIFWKHVELFKEITDEQLLQKEAKHIIEEYIVVSSKQEINISQASKLKVIKDFNENKIVTPDFFNDTQIEVYFLMKRDSFRNFLSHELFKQTWAMYSKLRKMNDSDNDNDNDKKEIITESSLTERDWRYLLTGAKEITMKKGEDVVIMGKAIPSLYRLKKGSLRVYQTNNGEETTLTILNNPGTVIGEVSVLGHLGRATASVKCETDSILHKIELSFIFKLFEREADLAKRFYISVGKNLARLLQEISSVTKNKGDNDKTKPKNIVKTIEEKEVEEQENSFHNIFSLSEEELLLCKYPCSYDKVIIRKGTFYIAQQGIYFYAKIFSQKTREGILIKDITNIEIAPQGKVNSLIKINCGKRKYRFIFKKKDATASYSLIRDLLSVVQNSNRANLPTQISFDESSEDKILSSEDWDIILSGGKQQDIKRRSKISMSLMTFSKGDVILQEGNRYSMVCQIASGSCSIEKILPDSNMSVVLGSMHQGEVFGEINFLTGNVATASVIAETTVEMYVVGPTIATLFHSHPNVVIRFYHYLCASLAKRIAQREKEGWGRK